ncbi:DUF5808 domain-containing protein [Algoriphagus sp. PAP.12]|uniref:DUF5808 domain-containing protein n=1 Tax=Algoriphagus sp. PAP.12 TaxID=2996678 RepID=UPI003FA3B15C
MSSEKLTKQQLRESHQNPDNWIWGIFYFNHEDKRLMPPKRNRMMGWTVNFANPFSIGLFVLILGGIIGISFLLKNSK